MGIVWTLRARGLAPSLGAGGSLVVAALCCLLFATALVTFRDWPGRGELRRAGRSRWRRRRRRPPGRAASGPARRRRRVLGRARRRRAPPAAARPLRPAPRRRRAAGPGGHEPAAAGGARRRPRLRRRHAARRLRRRRLRARRREREPAARAHPGPVEGVVETGREVTKPLLPPVVQQPIQPVLDTVQAVGKTVDDTVAPLLPTLP